MISLTGPATGERVDADLAQDAAVDLLDLPAQLVLVHAGQLLVVEQDVAADQDGVHRVPGHPVDQVGHRVVQRPPVEVRGVEHDQVGLLAGLQRAGHVVHPQRGRAADRGHLHGLLRGDRPGVAPGVPGQQRRQLHRAADVLMVGDVLGVGAQRHGHPGGQQFRPLAGLRGALGQLERGARVLRDPRAGVGHVPHVAVVQAGHVVEQGPLVERADLVHVLDRPVPERGQLQLDLALAG